jgi:hypothetical protein
MNKKKQEVESKVSWVGHPRCNAVISPKATKFMKDFKFHDHSIFMPHRLGWTCGKCGEKGKMINYPLIDYKGFVVCRNCSGERIRSLAAFTQLRKMREFKTKFMAGDQTIKVEGMTVTIPASLERGN